MQRSTVYSFCAILLIAIIGANAVNTNDWKRGDKVDAESMHRVVFAITPAKNAAANCDRLLSAVSQPSSPLYGNYLSLPEVGKLFINRYATERVMSFLKEARADRENWSVSSTQVGDFITLDAPVADLEDLLGASFHHYSTDAHSIKRSSIGYKVPEAIASHVDFIGNVDTFPPAKRHIIRTHRTRAAAIGSVDPETINKVYGITSNHVTSKKASMALFEALGQDFSPDDLRDFQHKYHLKDHAVDKVIGPNEPNKCKTTPDDCGEANLDVQYIMAVAQNVHTTYWSIDENAEDPFLNWVLALANMTEPPLVHSISYGSISTEDNRTDVFRFNLEACKLGLRGVTIVVSSGDDGVANFEARNDPKQCGFHPSFPATSPYVTAVGATQGPESGNPEIACSSTTGGVITTGGGFSYYFSRPNYQDAAVLNYLKNGPGLPPTNLFNSTGRGYPDVSCLGYNYNVIIGGHDYQESGTSASAPVFAGMLTLINNQLLNKGKTPVGFVNPALYALSAKNVFNDITVGENNCCAGEPGSIVCCQYGFNATVGWDPLTGLGSPRFETLEKEILALKSVFLP